MDFLQESIKSLHEETNEFLNDLVEAKDDIFEEAQSTPGLDPDEVEADSSSNQIQYTNHHTDTEDKDKVQTPKEMCLIERDGQYILVSQEEMEAQHQSSSYTQAKEKRITRPKTAPNTISTKQPLQRSSSSAKIERNGNEEYAYYYSQYRSPYGLTEEEKETLKKKQKENEERKKREEEQRKKEEEEKRKDNKQAFESWLALKQKLQAEKLQRNEKIVPPPNNSQGQQRKQPERHGRSVEQWYKQKRDEDAEKQRQFYERQKMQEQIFQHSFEERENAFREWRRRKALETKQKEDFQRQLAKYTHLQLRRARKSRNLAFSSKEDQSFFMV